MKANGYTCTDCRCDGGALALDLCGVTAEEALAADWAVVRVCTDDGDLVEAYAGYAPRSATAHAVGGLTLVLASGDDAAVLRAMRQVAEAQEAQRGVNAETAERLDEQDMALAELAGLIAGEE